MVGAAFAMLGPMNILIIGAGVLGSMYAGLLSRAGHDVTVLARGERLEQIRTHGIVLEEIGASKRLVAQLAATDSLAADEAFELVLVVVRADQLGGVLPMLAPSRSTPNVLFLMNNPCGPSELTAALGADRVLTGFPCGGGVREGHLVRYARHRDGKAIPTTIGEVGGTRSERLQHIAQAFAEADLPVAVETNVDAWLKTHAALVMPSVPALRIVGGNNYALAEDTDTLRLLVAAIREGLRVVRALGQPLRPWHVRAIEWLPISLSVGALRKLFRSEFAEVALAGHAKAAPGELDFLLAELRALGNQASVPMPALDQLMAQAGEV